MLGTVAGVAEGLLATWVLAQVWLLACVAPQVDLQILQAGEGFTAAFKLQERLMRGVLSPEGPPAWKQHPKPAFSGPNHLLSPLCIWERCPSKVSRAKTQKWATGAKDDLSASDLGNNNSYMCQL